MFLVSRENWGTESGLRAIETNPQRKTAQTASRERIGITNPRCPRHLPHDIWIHLPQIRYRGMTQIIPEILLSRYHLYRWLPLISFGNEAASWIIAFHLSVKPLSSLAIFHASHDVQLDGGWPCISCHRADYLVSTIVCIRVEKNMFLISWEIWLPLPRSFGDDSSVGIRCRLSKSEAIMGRKINGISCNNIMNDYM